MGKRLSKNATADDFTATVENTFVDSTESVSEIINSPINGEISISETTSVVVTTPDSIKKHLKALDDAVNSLEKTFFKIGFNLFWFENTNAYVQIGDKTYNTIADFAKSRYGISKTTTYDYINVISEFGKRNVNGEVTELDDKWKNYKSTQLMIIRKMDAETREKCLPSMKIKDLKALLDVQNGIGVNDDADEIENTANETIDSIKPFTVVKKPNAQELINISSVEDLENKSVEILEMIKKTLMQDNGIKYNVSIVMTW